MRLGCNDKTCSRRASDGSQPEPGRCACTGLASRSDRAAGAHWRAVDCIRGLALATARGEWILTGEMSLCALAVSFPRFMGEGGGEGEGEGEGCGGMGWELGVTVGNREGTGTVGWRAGSQSEWRVKGTRQHDGR